MKIDIIKSMKNNYMHGVAIILLIIALTMGLFLYKERNKYTVATENNYNFALYQVVDYAKDVEHYLAKSIISGSSEHSAETLMHVWREANLALSYLTQLPIASNELANTEKFFNQVSDYSFALAKKAINGENLEQAELDNLKKLYDYSIDLSGILEQLSSDMGEGTISWKELTKNVDTTFAQQVDNLSATTFSNIDTNFGEYEGLIYDGAYSEHIENAEKKGLIGEEVTEEQAKQKAVSFIGEERIDKIELNSLVENGNIVVYDFTATLKNKGYFSVAISKKGGHIVVANYNRDVSEEKLSQEEANKKGKEFLEKIRNNKHERNLLYERKWSCHSKLRIYARRHCCICRLNKTKNCIRQWRDIRNRNKRVSKQPY